MEEESSKLNLCGVKLHGEVVSLQLTVELSQPSL
jgi:hypothetical protein